MSEQKKRTNWKWIFGTVISLLFILLAFRQVDFSQMGRAFAMANYWWLVPALAVLGLSLLLRAWRWQYLLAPLRQVNLTVLFASLAIGYMANTFLPAHLGEVVRACHTRSRTGISASAIFATIVIERLIDILTLLLLLGLALAVFPFPGWVQKSGVIMLFLVVFSFVLLLLLKRCQQKTLDAIRRFSRFLPSAFAKKINDQLGKFLNGIVPLRRGPDYLLVIVFSLLIWLCYALIIQLLFNAFAFAQLYNLSWMAALVVLVITTISIVVPSSPGYIGSYHFLCQLALGLFAVPKSPALSFAFVLHGVNIFPVFFLGLFILGRERISLKQLAVSKKDEADTGRDACAP